jgi:nitrogen fixation/metabolism regulation signal transduction histidine kinase
MTYSQSKLREGIRYCGWLSVFSLLIFLSVSTSQQEEKTAVSLILIISCLLVAVYMLNMQFRSIERLRTVLKSLGNGDPTLGLSKNDPLITEYNRIQDQIQDARMKIEAQHEFLQTMLIHIDTGILVVNQSNQVIHSNPALERLLGLVPKTVEKETLFQLGEFIQTSNQTSRCVIPWKHGDHEDTFSVRLACPTIQSQPLKIVSIQSIYQALRAKEQQAYKDLSKVLTHEIANSIMPLASLAETCKHLMPDTLKFSNHEAKEDLTEGLNTIEKRAAHLDQFVRRFSESNQLPPPSIIRIDAKKQIGQVLSLFKNEFQNKNVVAELKASQSHYWLMADPAQLQQIIVNLIKNSLESMTSAAPRIIRITIAYNHLSQLFIDVQDSGLGLEKEILEQIFIPFFTTKNEGSGIGLSLSRQIMFNHGGDLLAIDNSQPNGGLTGAWFRLVFG